jgi:hypothetical protein
MSSLLVFNSFETEDTIISHFGIFDRLFEALPLYPSPWLAQGGRGLTTDMHLPPSTFTGKFFKKNRHVGFAVFIDIWSMLLL